jgi:hypothetical protein
MSDKEAQTQRVLKLSKILFTIVYRVERGNEPDLSVAEAFFPLIPLVVKRLAGRFCYTELAFMCCEADAPKCLRWIAGKSRDVNYLLESRQFVEAAAIAGSVNVLELLDSLEKKRGKYAYAYRDRKLKWQNAFRSAADERKRVSLDWMARQDPTIVRGWGMYDVLVECLKESVGEANEETATWILDQGIPRSMENSEAYSIFKDACQSDMMGFARRFFEQYRPLISAALCLVKYLHVISRNAQTFTRF